MDSRAAWAAHGFSGEAEELIALRTLPRAWVGSWRVTPSAPILFDAATGWLCAAQADSRSAVVAWRFSAFGLRTGDRVLMSCQPSVDLVIAHIAALRLGLVVVPANTAFASEELANVIEESGSRLAVLDDPTRQDRIPSVGPAVDLADGIAPALDQAGADDPAMLVFTSGTTGRPKGALLSHGNLLASAEALVRAWDWTPRDRLILSLPLFHMHGLGVGVHGTLLAGASAVIVAKFSPDAILDAIAEHDATMFFGVPTMYVRLLESDRVCELGSLRLCVSGSAPLAAAVWERLETLSGQRVVERYGMSETVMLVSNPVAGVRRPGSVGLALPGVELRLATAGDGDGVIDGAGEIEVAGPNVFAGYWGRPEANAEAFTPDGWFRTGDLGQFDPVGYLRIVGRSKDLIITGGFNVYPRDIEDVMRAHPSVIDVAVVGEPSAEWGETVTACLVAVDGADVDDLFALAATHLAGYQRPRRIVFVDELPRNALGKVVKTKLVEQIRRTTG